MSLQSLKSMLNRAKATLYEFSPAHPLIVEIEKELCSYHGVNLRLSQDPDRRFEAELPNDNIVKLPSEPDQCFTVLETLLFNQQRVSAHKPTFYEEFKRNRLGIAEGVSPTQYEIDKTKIKRYGPYGQEIKPKIDTDDLDLGI